MMQYRSCTHTAEDELFAAIEGQRFTPALFWNVWPNTACRSTE